MINLRHLLFESFIDQINDLEKFDIGDGFLFVNIGNGIFKVYDSKYNLAMSLYVSLYSNGHKLKIPYIRDVLIYPEYRDKGLYRRCLPVLKKIYGHIRSHDSGETSDEAEKAWKSLNAKHIQNTDNKELYGGSWYVYD